MWIFAFFYLRRTKKIRLIFLISFRSRSKFRTRDMKILDNIYYYLFIIKRYFQTKTIIDTVKLDSNLWNIYFKNIFIDAWYPAWFVRQICVVGKSPSRTVPDRTYGCDRRGNKSFRPKTSSPLVVSPLVVSPQIWCLDVSPLHPSRFAPFNFFTLVVSPLYFLTPLKSYTLHQDILSIIKIW